MVERFGHQDLGGDIVERAREAKAQVTILVEPQREGSLVALGVRFLCDPLGGRHRDRPWLNPWLNRRLNPGLDGGGPWLRQYGRGPWLRQYWRGRDPYGLGLDRHGPGFNRHRRRLN